MATIPERILAAAAIPMTISEIAEAVDLSKQQVYNAMSSLTRDGLIEKTEDKKYVRLQFDTTENVSRGIAPSATKSASPKTKPASEEEKSPRAAIILDQIDHLGKTLIESILQEPVRDAKLKIAALKKLAGLFADDLSELLTEIVDDIQRLADLAGEE